jgi:heme oxygenase
MNCTMAKKSLLLKMQVFLSRIIEEAKYITSQSNCKVFFSYFRRTTKMLKTIWIVNENLRVLNLKKLLTKKCIKIFSIMFLQTV